MRIRRELCTRGILLVACLGLAATAHADCNGPQVLTAALRAHPTTKNAVQLADWFGSHNQFECAVTTLRAAEKKDPNSAQLHYLEALALVGARDLPKWSPLAVATGASLFVAFWDLDNWMLIGAVLILVGFRPMRSQLAGITQDTPCRPFQTEVPTQLSP